MLNAPNSATGVEKVNLPSALSVSGSAELLSSVTCMPLARPFRVPLTVNVTGEQVTATEATSAVMPAPAPCCTVQMAPLGSVATVTAYAPLNATGVAKLNGPFVVSARASAPLSSSTTFEPAASPVTVPETVNICAAQATWTLVTLFVIAAPLPFVTVHTWPRGWVATVTEYALLALTPTGKVNLPAELTDIGFLPFNSSTTLSPGESPETEPDTPSCWNRSSRSRPAPQWQPRARRRRGDA